MRVPALFLFLLLVVAASPSESRAEKVKTNQSTGLLSRPGERGKVLLTVPEGKGMTVLAKDGRWLKVRVSGRTGWVPRSKVDVSDEIARNTRRRPFVDGRGKGRGFGGEEGPDDRVGADAIGQGIEPAGGEEGEEPASKGGKGKGKPDVGKGKPDVGKAEPAKADAGKGKADAGKGKADAGKGKADAGKGKPASSEEDDPDAVVVEEEGEEGSEARPTARVKAKTVALADPAEGAEESFPAAPDTVLYPTGNTQGKYTEVENDDGDLGYVLTSSLELSGGGDGEPSGGGVSASAEGPPRARQIDARARLGVTFLSQAYSGGGKVSSSAATLALGGALTMPYKAKFIVGGELTYDYAKAIPGVRNMDRSTTSIGLHNLRLRALGGYDLKKANGLALFGRLGFHYQSYQVANVEDLTKNKSKLPSEIIKAPALGVGVAVPRLTKKIGVRGSLDAILFSLVSQTKNLEDGKSPSARGALLEAGMTYRLRKDMDLLATYDLTYFSMGFGAPVPTSKRAATAPVSRGDQFHSFTVGIAMDF
jgi:hypothetical protein